MELDDLKKPWQQATEKSKPSDTDIMKLIQNKQYGPAASLKKRFRKQLIIIPLLLALIIPNLSRHHDLFSDVLFWCFIGTGIAMCLYFLHSYRLTSSMQNMERPVKANLEKQVAVLEKGFNRRLRIVRILVVFYIVSLEALLYLKQEPSLVKWYAQPPGIRLLCYAGFVTAFFFASKIIVNYKYGKHIRSLKELVGQMQ